MNLVEESEEGKFLIIQEKNVKKVSFGKKDEFFFCTITFLCVFNWFSIFSLSEFLSFSHK